MEIERAIDKYHLTSDKLAKIIDHTFLKPEATEKDIIKLCNEAKKYKFGAICINQNYIQLAKKYLGKSGVKICTVVGFPLGASLAKAYETELAIKNGADEIDMVIDIGMLKSKKYNKVKKDIASVVEAANDHIVKVILETCLLNRNEIIKACQIAKKAGADFVKTSTGFNKGGATVEHVRLMRKVVGSDMGVKAAGGIRNFEKALEMIEAGAPNNNLEYLFRIGTSSGVEIIKEFKKYLGEK